MKFLDLSKLDLKRLKTYRRSLLPQVMSFTHCDCGSTGCDNAYQENKDNPNYIKLSTELKRVNEELSLRQKAAVKKNFADVPRIKK
jgi:hypothetical protein